MKKNNLKKYTLSLISAAFAGAGVILACAGGWYSVDDMTNYTPSAHVDSAYSPFLYSFDGFYYNGYDEDQNSKFSNAIVKDWHLYFDKKIPETDLSKILLQTSLKSIDSLMSGKIPAVLAGTKIATLNDKKSKEFFNYLLLAKKAESFALNEISDWYYKEKPVKEKVSLSEFCNSTLTAYKTCKDNFIRQRYLFQYVRACYFKGDHSSGVNLFEKETVTAPKNDMYYRTLSYVAGSLKKAGNIHKANYYYSLVYNGNDILKTTAHFSFKPQNENDFQQTLALCKSNDEKCTLWQMLGVFYKDEIRSMKEIVKIDPKSEKLDLLLSRAVNRIELHLFGDGYLTGYESDAVAKQKSVELQTVIKDLIRNDKMNKPSQWYAALGYLQSLNKEYKTAAETFVSAEKNASNDQLVLDELRVFKLINTINENTKITRELENKLLPEFLWLQQVKKNGNPQLRTTNVSGWVRKIMSKKYRDQGDLQRAEFFAVDEKFYQDEKRLHDMQNFLVRTDLSPYENYCAGIYDMTAEDLFEYEAVEKTFQDKIDEAIALMEKAGKKGKIELYSNPFNGGIKDCHDCDHSKPQKIKYSKLSTLKKMKEMKDQLASDPYNNALLLANAYYNINWYGSARMFYLCEASAPDGYNGDYLTTNFNKYRFGMELPVKYYTMALNAAKTDEQKAKCVYMLAKCERNEWYNKDNMKEGIDFIAFKNFAELKKYNTTKYYQEVLKECGYFKRYTLKR